MLVSGPTASPTTPCAGEPTAGPHGPSEQAKGSGRLRGSDAAAMIATACPGVERRVVAASVDDGQPSFGYRGGWPMSFNPGLCPASLLTQRLRVGQQAMDQRRQLRRPAAQGRRIHGQFCGMRFGITTDHRRNPEPGGFSSDAGHGDIAEHLVDDKCRRRHDGQRRSVRHSRDPVIRDVWIAGHHAGQGGIDKFRPLDLRARWAMHQDRSRGAGGIHVVGRCCRLAPADSGKVMVGPVEVVVVASPRDDRVRPGACASGAQSALPGCGGQAGGEVRRAFDQTGKPSG